MRTIISSKEGRIPQDDIIQDEHVPQSLLRQSLCSALVSVPVFYGNAHQYNMESEAADNSVKKVLVTIRAQISLTSPLKQLSKESSGIFQRNKFNLLNPVSDVLFSLCCW